MALPAASFGPNFALVLVGLGIVFAELRLLVPGGMSLFVACVVVQLINLPVEFDASRRAARELAALNLNGELPSPELQRVLRAAAFLPLAMALPAALSHVCSAALRFRRRNAAVL